MEDRATCLDILSPYAQKHALRIWAYCLMDNYIHLLAVPEDENSLARAVGLTNQVYAQYLNRKLSQLRCIWQNRFYSCIVESDPDLWAVACYNENNPVKAGLVESAEDYPWSSAKAHLAGAADASLDESLWMDENERSAYAEFVMNSDISMDKTTSRAASTGRPLGTEAFMSEMESMFHRILRPRKPGRPRKMKEYGECP